MVIIAKDENHVARMIRTHTDGHLLVITGRFKTYEDAAFVTGESPVTLDVNTDLGRNGKDGFIINDGAGNFTVAISDDGTNYSSEHTMKSGEVFSLTNIDIDKIRITWVADSAYRVVVI